MKRGSTTRRRDALPVVEVPVEAVPAGAHGGGAHRGAHHQGRAMVIVSAYTVSFFEWF